MRYRVPPRMGYVFEPTADGLVLFLCPLPSGPSTALTGSGAVIWTHAVEEGGDVAQLVADDFGVDVQSIKDDVEDFLQHLIETGLLVAAV